MRMSRDFALHTKVLSTVALLVFLLAFATHSIAQSPEQATPLTDVQIQARDTLNQGVAAFKNVQFEEATRLFTRAKELDPSSLNARLYLAMAYASQYIPGVPGEENTRQGNLATDAYREVLQMDARNLSAIDGLASLLYQRAGQPFDPQLFAESKSYHQKHIELKPQDLEPYYFAGVIDWALAFRGNTKLRQEFNQSVGGEGLKDVDPMPEVLRQEYVRQYGATIDEGIDFLNRALELKPDYDDAMAYLNLLYRRKADTVDVPSEREHLTEMADDLLDKVKDIKQEKAKRPN
jgi:tetratricopeptide (TPR) repeat protein